MGGFPTKAAYFQPRFGAAGLVRNEFLCQVRQERLIEGRGLRRRRGGEYRREAPDVLERAFEAEAPRVALVL